MLLKRSKKLSGNFVDEVESIDSTMAEEIKALPIGKEVQPREDIIHDS